MSNAYIAYLIEMIRPDNIKNSCIQVIEKKLERREIMGGNAIDENKKEK